jgi:hypothetical protein
MATLRVLRGCQPVLGESSQAGAKAADGRPGHGAPEHDTTPRTVIARLDWTFIFTSQSPKWQLAQHFQDEARPIDGLSRGLRKAMG